MHVLLQYQSKSYYIIGQEVYYSIGRFYYIIGQLLQYRAFITLSVGTALVACHPLRHVVSMLGMMGPKSVTCKKNTSIWDVALQVIISTL